MNYNYEVLNIFGEIVFQANSIYECIIFIRQTKDTDLQIYSVSHNKIIS